jgi:hypothetical protein
MGPLGAANYEIREAERHDKERRMARLAEPRRLTDGLLTQLEELNLDGVRLVPASYGPALTELRELLNGWAGISPPLLDRLQPGRRTADLIEAIFGVQEIISPPTLPAGTLALDDEDAVN